MDLHESLLLLHHPNQTIWGRSTITHHRHRRPLRGTPGSSLICLIRHSSPVWSVLSWWEPELFWPGEMQEAKSTLLWHHLKNLSRSKDAFFHGSCYAASWNVMQSIARSEKEDDDGDAISVILLHKHLSDLIPSSFPLLMIQRHEAIFPSLFPSLQSHEFLQPARETAEEIYL